MNIYHFLDVPLFPKRGRNLRRNQNLEERGIDSPESVRPPPDGIRPPSRKLVATPPDVTILYLTFDCIQTVDTVTQHQFALTSDAASRCYH